MPVSVALISAAYCRLCNYDKMCKVSDVPTSSSGQTHRLFSTRTELEQVRDRVKTGHWEEADAEGVLSWLGCGHEPLLCWW